MRGTPDFRLGCRIAGRIIPAYAGNTLGHDGYCFPGRDHPRVCGEHIRSRCSRNVILGSSPRMRGTPKQQQVSGRVSGIIPAYAGNTSRTTRTAHGSRDHPRVCGEHGNLWDGAHYGAGSSPRMRGTLVTCPSEWVMAGIIPAYAGNTYSNGQTVNLDRDHPRVCGEHLMPLVFHAFCAGSSPRMRGTPWIWFHTVRRSGIIPAYAGNTVPVVEQPSADGDHPRVCGEHRDHHQPPWRRTGSSPRMRGTLADHAVEAFACGIIPAYAGNT